MYLFCRHLNHTRSQILRADQSLHSRPVTASSVVPPTLPLMVHPKVKTTLSSLQTLSKILCTCVFVLVSDRERETYMSMVSLIGIARVLCTVSRQPSPPPGPQAQQISHPPQPIGSRPEPAPVQPPQSPHGKVLVSCVLLAAVTRSTPHLSQFLVTSLHEDTTLIFLFSSG